MTSLQTYPDLNDFLSVARPYWQAMPARCNLQWSLAEIYVKNGRIEDHFILFRDGEVFAVGLQTDPARPLILTAKQPLTPQEVRLIIHRRTDYPGLIAERAIADSFLAACRLEPLKITSLLGYRLDQLVDGYQIPGGVFGLAKMQDIDLLAEWIRDFLVFIEEFGGSDDYRDRTIRMIEAGQLYVYSLSGKPVAIAGNTRSNGGVAAVNYVYTPPENRGKGYASAVVGHLSAQLLESHDHCVLYADRDYAPSNRVYQKLGYFQIGESVEVEF